MPFTQLDERSALVLIDLQKGIVGMPTAHDARQVVQRAAELARAFRAHDLPVVLFHVTGRAPGRTDAGIPAIVRAPDWAELVPELDRQPGDHVIAKQRWGGFPGTELDNILRGQGVTQIVLGGISTSVGVESTARGAYDLGYHVSLVIDAMTDRDAGSHQHSVEKVFPRLGETGIAADMLELLEKGRGAGA